MYTRIDYRLLAS